MKRRGTKRRQQRRFARQQRRRRARRGLRAVDQRAISSIEEAAAQSGATGAADLGEFAQYLPPAPAAPRRSSTTPLTFGLALAGALGALYLASRE